MFTFTAATILLGLHLAHNAFLSQIGIAASSSHNAWQNLHYYYLGVMYAQPTILAAWTWYGHGSLTRRLRSSTLIALMLGVAMLFGTFVNRGARMTVTDFTTVVNPVIQYAAVLGILSVTARFMRLPLPTRKSTLQVSLTEILSWTAVFAIALAGISAFLQSSTTSGSFDVSSILVELLLGPMFMALMSAPIVATILVVVGVGQRNVREWALILLMAQQLVLVALAALTPLPLLDLLLFELLMLVTMHLTAAVTALPFRTLHGFVNTPA